MKKSRRKIYKSILRDIPEGTQNYTVLNHLLQKGSITSYEAFKDYRITRLSGRIFNLRELGVDIESTMVYKKEKGNPVHYAVYTVK